MQYEYKDFSEIKPYEDNPRNNEPAIEAVASSLREFGWRQPVVLDKDGVIVAGHTRWLATGSENVYVNIVADHACVSARGAKSDGLTDVTSLHGKFIEDSKLRDEVERKISAR